MGLEQPIIICVTGHIEESYTLKAYKHGINGVSTKPLDLKMVDKVLRVLKFIWDRYTNINLIISKFYIIFLVGI
jgi:hypothetical protein